MGKKARLAQFLLNSGKFSSMKEVLDTLNKGKVAVGGEIVRTGMFEFRPNTRPVTVDGKIILARKKHLYLAFNKPHGIVCQKNDESGKATVWEYLYKNIVNSPANNTLNLTGEDIYAMMTVGRLDIATSGLLLLTTDGDFVHQIANPVKHVQKEYLVSVEGHFIPADAARLKAGVQITVQEEFGQKTYTVKALDVKILKNTAYNSQVSIIINEGKKHQIRSMLAVIGHPVLELSRVRIGRITLGNLKSGSIRAINKEEALL